MGFPSLSIHFLSLLYSELEVDDPTDVLNGEASSSFSDLDMLLLVSTPLPLVSLMHIKYKNHV